MKYNSEVLLPIDTTSIDNIANKAAVMVLICPDQQGVLVVHKADFLRRHAGEMAFPGGKLEHNESFLACAMRECLEEVGFDQQCYQLLGQLPARSTRHKVQVIPFVARLVKSQPIQIDQEELQDAFYISIKHLEDPHHHRHRRAKIDGEWMELDYYFFQRENNGQLLDYKIWGVTAHIISDFLKMEMTF